MNFINYIPKNALRIIDYIYQYFLSNPKSKFVLLGVLFVLGIYSVSKYNESTNVVYVENKKPVFTEGRILGGQKNSYLKSKERQLSKTAKKIMASNKALLAEVQLLKDRIEAKN